MTLKRALVVVLLTALAALSGCGDGGGRRDPDAGVDPGLEPVTYVVTGVTVDGERHPLVEGTEVRIRFADARITLTAGCNTMSGTYTLEQTRLTVEPLAMTDMGCDQSRMDQDSWLAGLFEKPVQLNTGAEPTIVSASTVLAMADLDTVHPDKPLLGTRWLLTSIGSGGADGSVSSVPAGTQAFIQIDAGRIALKDGCNQGSGTVEVAGDSLTFGPIATTKMACPDTAEVERAFAEVLAGTATYSIEEDRLTLTTTDRSLGFTAAP